MIMADFTTFIASLKAIADIAGMLPKPTDDDTAAKLLEMRSAALDAQSHALSLYESHSALDKQVSDLRAEVARLKDWGEQAKNYELKSLKTAFVYVKKPGVVSGEPPCWLCSTCFENRQKSILQMRQQARIITQRTSHHVWFCPVCKAEHAIHYNLSPGS